jgi:hypothetical protein
MCRNQRVNSGRSADQEVGGLRDGGGQRPENDSGKVEPAHPQRPRPSGLRHLKGNTCFINTYLIKK